MPTFGYPLDRRFVGSLLHPLGRFGALPGNRLLGFFDGHARQQVVRFLGRYRSARRRFKLGD